MGYGRALFFLFTSCFLLLQVESKCQPSYPCRNFTLQFPFTDVKDADCGLFPVHGCDPGDEYGYPRADIGHGYGYDSPHYVDILGNLSANTFKMEDFGLQDLLKKNSCLALSYLSPLMSSPSFSFTFPHNFSFFTCSKEPYIAEHFKDYQSLDCDYTNVYYRVPANDFGEKSGVPLECSEFGYQSPIIAPVGCSIC